MKASFKGQLQDLKSLQKAHLKVRKQQEAEKRRREQAARHAPSPGTAPAPTALSDADRRAFQASVRGVERLSSENRLEHQARPQRQNEYFQKKRQQAEGGSDSPLPAAAPSAREPRRRESGKVQTYNAEDGTYLRDPHAADLLKRLRQGQWMVEATLDLHGCTEDEASQRFDRFIRTCIEHEVRCVCIVHGQGHGSKNKESVLRAGVDLWLRNIPQVAAFLRSPVGGDGATIALLSAPKD